jgi:predicted esterase
MKTSRFLQRLCYWKAVASCVFLLWTVVSAEEDYFEARTFTTQSGFTMPYRFAKPINHTLSTSYPLVIFLHGAGDIGTDNEKQLNWFPWCLLDSGNRVNYPCYIMAPQCSSLDSGWSSFPWYPDVQTLPDPPFGIATVLSLIDSLRGSDSLDIDSNRIYIMGFSFGGEGTFDILTRRPQLFAAGIPISGIGDTAKTYLYKDIPLWIFHGSADSINYVTYSRMIVTKLQSLGVQTKYTEYAGMDHYIPSLVYEEPDLLPWIFAQNKHNSSMLLRPEKQAVSDNIRYFAMRKGNRVELSWNLSAAPDAAEIYTIGGRMLHRYPVVGGNASTISLPMSYAQSMLIVKFVKNGKSLNTEFISSGK